MLSITPTEFFKKVAVNAGVTDLDLVKDVYYGMIRTISHELRDRQKIMLPDWGKFYLILHKSRRAACINSGKIHIISPRPTVKFAPIIGVKKHFYELWEGKTKI